MRHPLYPMACRLIGRPVIAHHVSGRNYSGILQSVTSNGIYLQTAPVYASAMMESRTLTAELALSEELGIDASPVYFPAAYFGFGALTGFTLGSLAARRYAYGYGGGYGGYGYPYRGYGYW